MGRLIYDVKGRFAVHRITAEEARYKLCKITKIGVAQKGVPYVVTHDARTIRYPSPDIKVNDTVILDIESGSITEHVKFDSGNLCMITGGGNTGRVGIIQSRDRRQDHSTSSTSRTLLVPFSPPVCPTFS